MPAPHNRLPVHGESDRPSSESWGRRLRRGDTEAVEVVRDRVAHILAYGGLAIPPEEREDLEQEIVTEVWQAVNRSRFDFSGGFWGFVEVVSSRRAIDWLRARRDRAALPDEVVSAEDGPLRSTLARERAGRVTEILSDLDPRCRELITLRIRDELSYKEIARLVGKSAGSLRVHFYRCIQRVRERLDQASESGINERSS